MTRFEIEKMDIRFKGLSKEYVATISSGLRSHLLAQLEKYPSGADEGAARKVDEVDAGVIRIEKGLKPSELNVRVASRIAEMIMTTFRHVKEEGEG